MLIDSAVRAVKGILKDTKGLVAAIFYLLRATKGPDNEVDTRIQKKVFDGHKDAYFRECKMKW